MADFTPKSRPDDLKILGKDKTPATPPVDAPEKDDDKSTFDWCEAIRDHYENEGYAVTVKGLRRMADYAGLDPDQTKALRDQINELYASERTDSDELAPATKVKKSKKSETKPKKKEKVVATTTKSKNPKVKSENGKGGKHKNGSGNGKANPKTRATPQLSGKVIIDKSIRGVPVRVVRTPNGASAVTIAGCTLRNLLRWMGSKGWIATEAGTVCSRLLANMKGGDQYVKEVMAEGHVGSGAAGPKKGCFGAFKSPEGNYVKPLNALRK